MLAPPIDTNAPGVSVNWQGAYGVTYCVERATNLMSNPAFTVIEEAVIGQNGVNTWQDGSADPGGTYYYRVVVP